MEPSAWKEQVEREREFKNNFFKAHPRSPIPDLERDKFKGLNYYPPNLDYRFELELHEYEEKRTIKMKATQGEEQEYIRWGEFRFKLHGRECKLQAYKRGEETWLFVSFRDKTSGKETYGAGRYLDLQREEHHLGGGKWLLDFNRAYNPWCAYSEAYTCPLTPTENWLDVPIYAGEKNFDRKK